MRSWRESIGVLALVMCVASCHRDEQPAVGPACPPDSALTWTSFGEPFVRSWCTGCHSSALGEADRQGAPLGVDLDRLDTVRAYSERIAVRAVDQRTMPPAGGPSAQDLDRLDEWLACGAPGVDPVDPIDSGTEPPTDASCAHAGDWVAVSASCGGQDVTAEWFAMFPTTELAITGVNGSCAVDYHIADAGCDERQLWRSALEGPSSPIAFVGTVACAPAGCTWAANPDDVCTVANRPVTLDVGVEDLPGGRLALGPIAPPDLAGFCTELALVFERTDR